MEINGLKTPLESVFANLDTGRMAMHANFAPAKHPIALPANKTASVRSVLTQELSATIRPNACAKGILTMTPPPKSANSVMPS